MKEPLKILILEDSEDDAEIIQRLLKKEKMSCVFDVVETKEKYLQAIDEFHPDLILSDNTLPQFNATDALMIIRQRSLHIPFILVTGTVSEEFAANIMKSGATDYILKDRMVRLPSAIDAALKQIKIEKEKLEAENQLIQSEEKYRTLVEQAADGIFIADIHGKLIAVNTSGCNMSGYSENELMKMTIFDLSIGEDIHRNPFHVEEMKRGKTVTSESLMKRKDGINIDIETTGKILNDGRMLIFVRNITERKKAAKALAESENYLRTIVQTEPECIKLLNIKGELEDMNPAGLAMIEADNFEQVKNKMISEIVNKQYRKAFDTLTKNVFNGIPGTLEFEITGLKGTNRWLETHAVPMKNSEGKIISLLGVTRDITERKKAAEELRSNELRFRTLTSNAPVGIFQTNAEGKTIYVNDTWLEYTGLSFDEAMGDGWNNVLHPDDKEVQIGNWKEKSEKGLESSSEFRIVSKKGNIRWVIGKATPLFNKGGQVVSGYIGTLSDITESKRAEEALRQSEERLKQAQAIAHVGNWEYNFKSADSKLSDEAYKIFGLQPGEKHISIEDWLTFIHPDDKEYVKKEIEKAQTLMHDTSFYHRIIRKDEAVRYVFTESRLEFNNEGEAIGLYGIMHDITEIKKAENEILAMNEQLRLLSEHQQNIREEERTHIAREIHDELGQQLTVMKMDVSWLSKKLGTMDETIAKKAQDLSKILDDTVKTVRRIASELRPSLLDDLGLIAAIEWHLNEFKKRSGIKTILIKMEEEPALTDAARTGLFRIVQESLTNVARHANAKNVTVVMKQKNDQLVMRIEDDGIGFKKEKIANKKTLGILGMKERTYVMGGTYEIISKSGEGTIVSVSVPINGRAEQK